MFWSWGIVLVTTTASNMELLMRDTAGPEKMPWVQMAYTFTAPASNNLHEGKHRYTTEWRKNTSPTKRWQIQVSFTMVRSPYLKWFTTRKCVLHSSYRQQNNCPKRFTLKHDQGNRQKLQQGWCTVHDMATQLITLSDTLEEMEQRANTESSCSQNREVPLAASSPLMFTVNQSQWRWYECIKVNRGYHRLSQALQIKLIPNICISQSCPFL